MKQTFPHVTKLQLIVVQTGIYQPFQILIVTNLTKTLFLIIEN